MGRGVKLYEGSEDSSFDTFNRKRAEERFNELFKNEEVVRIVKYFSKKYHEGISSKITLEEMEAEGWVFVWDCCLKRDPEEDFMLFKGYLRASLPHVFLPGFIRYFRAKSRNLSAETSIDFHSSYLVDSSDVENLVSTISLIRKIEKVICSLQESELISVWMNMIYPGSDYDEAKFKYMKSKGYSYLRKLPESVVAELLGMSYKRYVYARDKIRVLVKKELDFR